MESDNAPFCNPSPNKSLKKREPERQKGELVAHLFRLRDVKEGRRYGGGEEIWRRGGDTKEGRRHEGGKGWNIRTANVFTTE